MIVRHRLAVSAPARSTGGFAALTVVMVLFFIMAMVAAYANRNLIFEQRTSSNNYRAAQALDAAEAGIDWTIALLNGGRIGAACGAPDNGGQTDFRTTYLDLTASGGYTARLWGNPVANRAYFPSCVFTGPGWTCHCPVNAAPALAAPATGAAPAFRVSMAPTGAPGTVQLTVRGCSNLGSGVRACHLASGSPNVDANVNIGITLGLVRALPTPPVAALTAGQGIAVDGAVTLRVGNPDSATAVTLHSGNAVTTANGATLVLTGPGGSGDSGQVQDAPLAALSANGKLFDAVFGMDATTYRDQPGVLRIDCAAGCTAADLVTPLADYPGRTLWIDGDLTLDNAAAFGTAARPLMLVATGTLTLSAAAQVTGFVFASNIVWQAGAGNAWAKGAMVAGNGFSATGNATIVYDADVLKAINLGYGSFVRVPGSWNLRQ
jgi:hypothetical protein